MGNIREELTNKANFPAKKAQKTKKIKLER